MSLSMNGGAQVPRGGGHIVLWCRYQGGPGPADNTNPRPEPGGPIAAGQIMIMKVGGFF
jgi:hypothetical protein